MKKQSHPKVILLGFILLFSGVFWIYLSHNQKSPSFSLAEAWHEPEISRQAFAQQANQDLQAEGFSTPLLLQTDERWAEISYGSGNDNNILHNGCALMSLAMVLSYQRQKSVNPEEIFTWAGDRYFVPGEGTAWTIFNDFAQKYQLQYHDLGNDYAKASPYLKQKIPVIASVGPGEFTDGGHILVLSAEQAGQVRVLDPNDRPAVNHYQQKYDPSFIAKQTIHYWTFTK